MLWQAHSHVIQQVVATYQLGGESYAPFGDVHVPGIGNILIPTQYSCWVKLLTTQAWSSNISLAQQLSGIAAGLMSVFIPKMGKPLWASPNAYLIQT